MKKYGIIIIIIGLTLTVFMAFTFFTNEKVMTIGKFEITRNFPHYLKWPPLIGIVVIAVGWVIYGQSSKNK
jgi:hypothetical protein